MVAGGSEVQDIIFLGIGRKQMGQSSFAGGSLNRASSRSSAARSLHSFLCFAAILVEEEEEHNGNDDDDA